MSSIRLNPELSTHAIRDVFARCGRVHIPDVLQAESAHAIHRALAASKDWQLSLNSGTRHHDLTEDQLQLLPPAQQVLLVERIHRNARDSFQYVFNNIPLHDLHAREALHEPIFVQVCDFLNSEKISRPRARDHRQRLARPESHQWSNTKSRFVALHRIDSPSLGHRIACNPQWRSSSVSVTMPPPPSSHTSPQPVPPIRSPAS